MLELFNDLMKANPLFAGGISMAIIGWLVVQAKDLPVKIWGFIKSQFTTSLTVYSEDAVFRRFEMWLSEHPDSKRSRRFSVTHWHNKEIDDNDYALTPGEGLHFLRHKGKIFIVSKSVNENSSTQQDFDRSRKQTINITVIGRNKKVLDSFLEDVKNVKEDDTTIPVYAWSSYDFSFLDRRKKRPLDTVYLNRDVKQAVVSDLQNFLSRKEWYNTRAVPFRRGYFFSGPAGTGKTSLIFALASLFNKSVYIINLASVENDNTLLKAVNSAGANFVVLEDIDSHLLTRDREAAENNPSTGITVSAAFKPTGKDSGVTLSGLLNALDGIGAKDGRILFITSNHPEVLDKALTRPGRVDRHFELNLAGVDEAREMYAKLGVPGGLESFLDEITPQLPISPAELQNKLVGRLDAGSR